MMLSSSSLVSARKRSISRTFSSSSRSSSVQSPCSTSVRRLQLRGQVLAALAVGLDQLDLVAVLQLARQAQAHLAAAGDHHALDRPVHAAQGARAHAAHRAVAASTKTSSPGSMRVSPSHHGGWRVAPVDGHDAHRQSGTSLRQLGDDVRHQRPAVHRAHRDQADPAVGELEHLQRLGVLDQLAHVGGQTLRGRSPRRREASGPVSGSEPCSNSGERTRAIVVAR